MKKNDQKQNKKRGVSQVGSSTKLPPVNSRQIIPQNFSMNSVSLQQQGLVSILHQYFIKNNYLQTLQSFQKDCCKPVKLNNKTQQQLKKQLLILFDQGHRDQFMAKFTQFVPLSMRTKDPQTMKMQFFIQLYFFIYPIHPALGKKKTIDAQAKQQFCYYLQGRGSALSKSAQFLQYYALANLQKPQQHPNFKILFTKQWAGELRKRVSYFFQKLYPSGKTPALVVMYDKFIQMLEKQSQMTFAQNEEIHQIQQQIIEEDENLINPQPIVHNSSQQQEKKINALINQVSFQQNKQEIEALKGKIQQLMEEKDNLIDHLQNQKSKCQHWQNTYHQFSQAAQSTLMESQTKWFQITQQIYSITDQILGVCKKLQSGIPLPDPDIVDRIAQKLSKYQKFIKMNLEQVVASSQPIDISLFNGDDVSVDQNRRKLIQLDFSKVKACLSQPEVPGGGEAANRLLWQNKILLLQALRWRISRPSSILGKRQAVLSFTLYDVLGFKQEDDKTFQNLIYSENETLALEAMAFVNALTRDYYGREYFVCEKAYKPCIALLTSDQTTLILKNKLLLSFQWCSTKKLAQQLMIKYDMIKALVFKLQKEGQNLQSRYMEFLVALLVNILLHKDGPKKAEEVKGEIVHALINLIQCENQNVRSYVHASLYPLLSHKSFREKAKQFGLLDNIKFLLSNNLSIQHNHQLSYLQQKLQKDEDDQAKADQKADQEDNDLDEFFNPQYRQDEGEQHIEPNINGIKGEELLMKEYSLTGPEAVTQTDRIQQLVGETLKRKSIMMDKSFYQRQSVSTPMLNNKMRRNISNNNSVYSNKSSNRILKSEMNSRSQISHTPNGKSAREKLDTVHQNNSEVSIKQGQGLLAGQPQHLSQQKLKGENDQQPVLAVNDSMLKKQVKVYQTTEQYKTAFKTRAKLVRTPPRK